VQEKIDRNLGILTSLLILMSGFTFPINQGIVVLLKLNGSTTFNTFIRAFVLIISLYLIYKSASLKNPLKLSNGSVCLILFYALYVIRVIFDLEFAGVEIDEKSNFLVYSFTIGATFIPLLAVALNAKFVDFNRLFVLMYYSLLISNIFILLNVLKDGFSLDLFLVRNVVTPEGQDENILNPITVGMYGELLALSSLVTLIFIDSPPVNKKILLCICFILGTLTMLLGASRGPIVSFLLICIYLSFIFILRQKSALNLTFSFAIVFLIIVGLILYVSGLSESDFFILERLNSFAENGDEVRVALFNGAWSQFLRSPIIGDRIVERVYKFYPHNLLIEVLMATGLIGFSLFFSAIITPLLNLKKLINVRNHKFLFYIIFIVFFMISSTSGSLVFSSDFFVYLSFILSLKI
jgi:hypothetical protein